MAASRRRTVLIVDDDEHLRRMLRVALRLAGFETREAGSGLDALAMLDRGERPDAIVLDVILPGIDGLAVRDELAAHTSARTVPIIVITGAKIPLDRLSPSCVLRKPFTPEALVATVEKCLQEF